MTVIITPTAQGHIDNQLAYGVARFGLAVTSRTAQRIERFFQTFLVETPRAGRLRDGSNLYETTIPKTPFVVVYRIESDALVRVLALFQQAQDRSRFELD